MSDIFTYKNKRPRLRVELDAETIVRVTVPTTDLVEETKANLAELTAVLNGTGAEQKKALYTLAATLINFNLDAVTVTVADLVNKYDWALDDLVDFYLKYMAFIDELENEKN